MDWASTVVSAANVDEAVAKASVCVRASLGGDPDLAVVFVSRHFHPYYPHVPELVRRHCPAGTVIGCAAGGVIGGGLELENRPAVSLTAARLPGVHIHSFQSDTEDLPDEDAPPGVWRAWLGLSGVERADFILLADPFTVRLEPFLNGLDYAYPGGAKIGGLASGGQAKGENALFLNDQCLRRGVVAVALSGDIRVDTIVAQGCRPVGHPMKVTKSAQNILLEIDGRAPLVALGELVESLGEEDRELMRHSLFIGIALDPFAEKPAAGDFLIRNLVGIDYENGSLAVGAVLTEGQLVQFHLRDKRTSAEDLDQMLTRYAREKRPGAVSGALLFSCVGRGSFLYKEPNHDSRVFGEKIGAVPLGGFFCNGEIGPVASSTHVHGYTSSFGLFCPAEKAAG